MEHSPVTLALTHFNRFQLVKLAMEHALPDPRIREIVISDDCSTDGSWENLKAFARVYPKVKLYRNPSNLDCYQNKMRAVQRSTSDWVILFDSDNVLPKAYLDRLWDIPKWNKATIYCPDFAEPHFNYTQWAGKVANLGTVGHLLGVTDASPVQCAPKTVLCVYCRHQKKGAPQHCPRSGNGRHRWVLQGNPSPVKGSAFGTLLNTANYFIPRDNWLSVWDGSVNPNTADSIFQAYNWIKAGYNMEIVPGLRYFHRVHNGSHYQLNKHKTGNLAAELEQKMKRLQKETTVPMVIPRTCGRMGNFLFQAACAMSYAWKHGLHFTVPTTTNDKFWNPIYLQHLASPLYDPAKPSTVIHERGFPYQELPFKEEWRSLNIVLEGYWQTEKYFKQYREDILREFGFPWELKKGVVSIHVRRGDYLRLVTKHPPVPKEWTLKAMAQFPGYHFHFFSDEIDWCKLTFGKRKDVTFSNSKSEVEDLVAMSQCEHHICSASTFSWWAMWLNRNPQKRVIFPKLWFQPGRPEDTRDIIPDWCERL